MTSDSTFLRILVAVLGLVIGSFLNVLALRSLEGVSIIWPPSRCPNCNHQLGMLDNIPVLSYLMLNGKCRYCKAPISWQYPAVELACALMFLLFFIQFGMTWECLGMIVFGCVLLTVTITDIREKLIPHDITYPAMLIGIVFSTVVRNDALGAMAGIGASYILFDFIAHYGLKFYNAYYRQDEVVPETDPEDPDLDEALLLPKKAPLSELEEFEVMGGGDAVLAAVISAWLGWQRLIVAVLVGFMVGTIFGMILLIREMHRAKILHECYKPAAIATGLGFCILALPMIFLSFFTGIPLDQFPWLTLGILGGAGGCLLGVVSVGTKVSKPFPFGPALAIGGIVAIFWDPIGTLIKGGA
jgi:leader peptidase (prepilin peptidase) / N-methyltransferase